MSDDKWKWTEPAAGELTPEQKERGGMKIVLVIGIIFLLGGLFFAWKIGAFSPEEFLGMKWHRARQNSGRDILFWFHLPWLFGAWATGAGIRYFFRNRKK